MTEQKAQYSPGSQASYGAGGGQLAKNGVVQETEEPQASIESALQRDLKDIEELARAIVAPACTPEMAEQRAIAIINRAFLMGAELARLREREALVGRLVEALSQLCDRDDWLPTHKVCICGGAPHEGGPCGLCDCSEYTLRDPEGHELAQRIKALLADMCGLEEAS